MKQNNFLQSASGTMRSLPMAVMATVTACLFLFASCGSDDDDSDSIILPDGEYPMSFVAAVEGTGAIAGNTEELWTAGDMIALQVVEQQSTEQETRVSNYTLKESGNSLILEAANGVTPFYWQNTTEEKKVSGWCYGTEYKAFLIPSWEVQRDQNKTEPGQSRNNYQRSDFLYAPEMPIDFSGRNTTELKFYHQTARVVINIVSGEAATTADAIQSVVIGNENNLALSGKPSTPVNSPVTWDTTDASLGTIIPKEDTSTGNYLKSYSALVIPQNMVGEKFIAVTLTDGVTYYYTPTGSDADLQTGKQYTYDITVKYGYLDVVKSSGGTWGSSGSAESVESKTLVAGFTAGDLKIGDYYYSDGTTSDGGYREYLDGTTDVLNILPVLTSAGGTSRKVIGIVCSTDVNCIGAAATEELNNNGVAPKGLVMALTDASYHCIWSESRKDEDAGGTTLINTQTLKQMHDNVDGYAETHWIINTYESSGTLKDTYAAFYSACHYGKAGSESADYAAPNNSTGWFIPSMGQWWNILYKLGGAEKLADSSKDVIEGAGAIAITNINKYLRKINDATEFAKDYDINFWSSSEYDSNFACSVGLSSCSDKLSFNKADKNQNYYVRCILAF